jgi:plastocyanin domain-containing protein
MKKNSTIPIIASAFIIGLALLFVVTRGGGQSNDSANVPAGNVVSVVDGKQIIDITAKGGYSPRTITAQAGMPTILRVKTSGTFDCSSALVIPSINYRKNLPPSGITEIALGSQDAGKTIQGVCGMGMYSFAVRFN